jgi:hypothetical protein
VQRGNAARPGAVIYRRRPQRRLEAGDRAIAQQPSCQPPEEDHQQGNNLIGSEHQTFLAA